MIDDRAAERTKGRGSRLFDRLPIITGYLGLGSFLLTFIFLIGLFPAPLVAVVALVTLVMGRRSARSVSWRLPAFIGGLFSALPWGMFATFGLLEPDFITPRDLRPALVAVDVAVAAYIGIMTALCFTSRETP